MSEIGYGMICSKVITKKRRSWNVFIVMIQFNAVIMRSKTTWYCIHYCSDRGRVWIWVWTHMIYPIPRPNRRAMGCICVDWGETNRVTAALHCTASRRMVMLIGCALDIILVLLIHAPKAFNSLAPARLEWNFRYVVFKLMSVIDGWGIPCEIALI